MYPLKFEHILKKVIWGGEKISIYKNLDPIQENVGESWEISTVPGYISIVSNGKWKGTPLTELIERYKGSMVGKKIYQKYGNTLPLLFKFIDTRDHCSVQVHPNDKIAKKRHDCNGKTEIWYIIDAEPYATLISGFSKSVTIDEYKKRIAENSLEEILISHQTKAGDLFFIPAGRIHAIGKGLLVAEIQQSSDITYRVYDYGRKDSEGTARQLHTEEAIEALDFSTLPANELKLETDKSNLEQIELANNCFFHVSLSTIGKTTRKEYRNLDSFVVYMCIKGNCEIALPGHEKTSLKQGESILLPASIDAVEIEPVSAKVKLLECYINPDLL